MQVNCFVTMGCFDIYMSVFEYCNGDTEQPHAPKPHNKVDKTKLDTYLNPWEIIQRSRIYIN